MTSARSRLLFVDLVALGRGGDAVVAPWLPQDADLADAAPWAGGALASLALLEGARRGDGAAFGIAVGDGVRRGLPTAARATVAARSPLTGRLSEGLVGGDLGRRLAGVADAVVLTGEFAPGDGVVIVDEVGRARVEHRPELHGLDPAQTHALLVARYGPCATLRIGAAAEHGSTIASLASGGEAASFVGRGGLGAAFAGHGLKALVVLADEVDTSPDAELVRALLASPRLAARADGGTFELGPARQARGELASGGNELYAQVRAAPRERVGCRGCPTPCGWAFDRGAGSSLPARFGKLWSLGPPLGLDELDDALALAAACDTVGVDSKEAGAGLARLAQRHGALGDRERLEGWIADLGRGAGEGWELAGGTGSVEASGAERTIAARLGACVSSNGGDPMRTFPFLLEAGGRGRLEQLLDGVPLPAGTEDPANPAGKGRVVWWHENLVAGLDLIGFCAFSAAGLLADGVMDLRALASRILPLGLAQTGRTDRVLLDAGDRVVRFRRELAQRWGGLAEAVEEDLRAAFEDYALWRSVGWSAAGAAPKDVPDRRSEDPGTPTIDHGEGAHEVTLRASGPLAEKLGSELRVALDRPTPLGELLEELMRTRKAPLIKGGVPLASTYRGGDRLEPCDLVTPGDELDLVIAIAGG